jgi:recombination protein RecA
MPKKKNFDLGAYKKTIKVADTALKKDKFVVLDECMHSVLGVPGLPLGHITQVFGKSDTGKTSLLFHAAAQAQKQGVLPVVIVTEGKVAWDRAELMGFSKDEAIVEENLEYLEDVFKFIDKIVADVSMGELPYDVMIFWDSVGNTLSRDEVEIQKDGTVEKKSTMMKAAKVISENMRVISTKVNSTRKISYPKSVGLMIVNQCYTKPPAFSGGMPSLVPYGGDSIWYRSSLVLKTARAKKLTATKDGNKYGFGIVAKITVDKNHIANVAHTGEFVITADSIIPNEKSALDSYKKEHKEGWGKITDEEGFEFEGGEE